MNTKQIKDAIKMVDELINTKDFYIQQIMKDHKSCHKGNVAYGEWTTIQESLKQSLAITEAVERQEIGCDNCNNGHDFEVNEYCPVCGNYGKGEVY